MSEEYLEAVAKGLYALNVPLNADVELGWDQLMQPRDRELWRSKARFVLSYADPSALAAGRGVRP